MILHDSFFFVFFFNRVAKKNTTWSTIVIYDDRDFEPNNSVDRYKIPPGEINPLPPRVKKNHLPYIIEILCGFSVRQSYRTSNGFETSIFLVTLTV